jgi:hypothetical protein
MAGENIDRLCTNAEQFNGALQDLANLLEADLSQVVRGSVLRLFAAIIKRSPVDTGAYRASHQIANREPGDKDGVTKSPFKPGGDQAAAKAWADGLAGTKKAAWTWHPGDGSIWIFNNVPYAYRLEEGHSKQAAAGIYNMALAQMNAYLAEEIAKTRTLSGAGE